MKYERYLFLYIIVMMTIHIACGGQHSVVKTRKSDTTFNKDGENLPYSSTSIVGYWRNRLDGLEVHITGLESNSTGSGSFKDINGRLVNAGKFRDIQFKGGNVWACQEFMHSHTLSYPQDPGRIVWQDAVIEMVNRNLIRVGSDLYDRL